MPSFSEMNNKVTVSIGLIIFIVLTTFAVTSFYLKQSTLESRMDKRYERIDERLDKVEELVLELEKCDHK